MEADSTSSFISSSFLQIEKEQCSKLEMINFQDEVSYIYNPLDYAFETHKDYVTKYCQTYKDVLFLGMNPGPFGMAQNGVPFGEVRFVKEWLCIEGQVGKPPRQHPNRIIQGLECPRSEVSGRRFWGLIKDLSKEPATFFHKCFVHNYCPLAFVSKTGKNITPPELKVVTRRVLLQACDDALCRVVRLLKVQILVAVGKFAAQRAKTALASDGLDHIKVSFIMHPSPVNPQANKGWEEIARKQLTQLGVLCYITGSENVPEPTL